MDSNIAPANISTSQEPDMGCSTEQGCHENNPSSSLHPETKGSDIGNYGLATKTTVTDNTTHPSNSTDIDQVTCTR